MPVKSEPYYWLECDTCGARCDYGDFSAMADEGSAIDGAIDAEWTTDGERWHCDGCPVITNCDRCGAAGGADARPDAPPMPDGEYARVEILGHDSHTGWVTESTRQGSRSWWCVTGTASSSPRFPATAFTVSCRWPPR